MILRKFQEFHTQIHERKIIFCSKKFLSFAARIPKRKKTTQQFLHLQEIYVVFVCFPSLNNQKICWLQCPVPTALLLDSFRDGIKLGLPISG